ncbi:methyltransferase domain-containing protein [Sinomonas sp. ASV322]|uniref:methyltransferase domain-containing protein n=1 Tax=Sinomonas sp. ASV322 TaxID=3041920 RepID=UPI0027DDECCE|nr:methyltransferase domain-containing protein [Sinomonas sp. ASV322]MDQ4503503.1 methyltransferase domain-containing protein [Sinomonas sp. ASV322]
MDSCCGGPHDPGRDHGYDAIFDSRFSGAIAKRYGRRGLRQSERRIVEFLAGTGIEGATVLEIGGGVGEIQLELLKRGAARAVNLELSAGYEEDAARLIERAGFGGRIERRLGVDLAEEGDGVEAADVVVLHRVVCCYPDYAKLLTAAADHARRAIVFSYPTANLPARAFIRLMNGLLAASGRSFRGFIHPPEAMADVVRGQGLEPSFQWHSPVWNVLGAVRAG